MAGNEGYEIYVGKLSWNISEPQLEDAFSRFGKILNTRIMRERDSGRSRGYGFISFANRRAMDNAIREMDGEKFDRQFISVNKAKFRREGQEVEPRFRESYKRRGRSMVRGECFRCGCSGHWARECPWFERDDSEDCHGGDNDQYVDERYDRGLYRDMDHLDTKDDEDGSCISNNREVHLPCLISNSVENPQKISLVKNEEGEGDSKASLLAINFSQEDARKMLSTMGLLDELPFRIVESERFHKFCKLMQSKFVIPSRVTMAKDWFQIYLSKRKCLENVLTRNHQRVCLAVNKWTSDYDVEYMVLTAHFIDNDWNLHKRILNFCQISNNEGETIGRTMEKCLLEWGIKRVVTITVDKSCSNDGAIGHLSKKLAAQNALLSPSKISYVGCCSHLFKVIVDDASKDLHESIEKIRNNVKHMQSSTGMMLHATKSDQESETEDLFDLDIPGITISKRVLKIFMNLQEMFEEMKGVFPKACLEGTPSLEDWENFRAFLKLLIVLSNVTSKFSGSLCVTSNEYFHELCSLRDLIREYSQTENICLGRMIRNIQAKFNHYWGPTKGTNFLSYVAVVLDPRYKLKFVQYCFGEFWENNVAKKMTKMVERTLQKMCDEYFNMPRDDLNDGISQSTQCIDIEMSVQSGSSRPSMAEKFRNCLDKEVPNDCKMELDNYLYEPCHRSDDDNFDVLKWWKLNSARFRILSEIAKDVLAIPMSTTTSLSTEARVLNRFYYKCPPKMVEAIICAQSWLRSKSIIADEGDGIEDVDRLDQEFSNISLEMDLDSISD